MRLCSYVVVHDSGFAPNPFWGYCTLAACTPNHMGVRLREGDWVIGTEPAAHGGKLVFSMRVSEVLHFDEYFHDPRFQKKKPNIEGEWRERCGDNIYRRDSAGHWRQSRSRHHQSAEHRRKDTKHPHVFISEHFYYFGSRAVAVPEEFQTLVWRRQGCKCNYDPLVVQRFLEWLGAEYTPGIHGLPRDAETKDRPGLDSTCKRTSCPQEDRNLTSGPLGEACDVNVEPELILAAITEYYFKSADFNGTTPYRLVESSDLSPHRVRSILQGLIQEDLVFLNTTSNFHVKLFGQSPIEDQLKQLNEVDLRHCCVYPTEKHLDSVVDRESYEGRPYTLRLALGAAQLKPVFFEPVVLETYLNDPRMRFWCNDIGGQIYITDDACEAGHAEERDQVFLPSFGFGYDEEMNRVVAVWLRDLSGLTPEHQRLWETKELPGQFALHPDYFRTQIKGEFPERLSLCDAFVAEMGVINQMTNAMVGSELFRKTYDSSTRPREFGFMIRPTQKGLDSFIHLLDKMISENLDRNFFRGKVELEEEVPRRDGKVEIRQKGTLRLLEEWLRSKYRPSDDEPLRAMFATFRKIRKMRQQPAHSVHEDEFDQRYFTKQRELLDEAYTAIRTVRLILANHPNSKAVKVDEALYEGRIWRY